MLGCRGGNPSVEPSVSDLETWLEYQSTQIGTPVWWKELGAIPGITDWQKFAWKIQASFYIPEVQSRMFPEEVYSAPPAPQSLNRGAYFPDNLTYQDVRQQPELLTVAFCQCLQNWVEKCNPPRNPDFCPLAESIRELRQAIWELMNITREDVIQDLKMEEHGGGQQLSMKTILSQVLGPPADRQKVEEFSGRPGDKAVKCAPPTLRLEWEDRFMLLITSLMSQLTIEPGNGDLERGRNLIWSHQMVAVLPPQCPALSIEEGTTSTGLNIFSMGPVIEDITNRE